MTRLMSFAIALAAIASPALAQTDSVVLVVASRGTEVDASTIRDGLRAEGIDVRSRDEAGACTDTIVLLVDSNGRRVTAFTRSPTGVDVHVLHTPRGPTPAAGSQLPSPASSVRHGPSGGPSTFAIPGSKHATTTSSLA